MEELCLPGLGPPGEGPPGGVAQNGRQGAKVMGDGGKGRGITGDSGQMGTPHHRGHGVLGNVGVLDRSHVAERPIIARIDHLGLKIGAHIGDCLAIYSAQRRVSRFVQGAGNGDGLGLVHLHR